jgi:hypothetical protein
MALTKRINYYIDDDGYYRRIPWDSWLQDGIFCGLSPVGITFETLEWDSNGNVTCNRDFVDIEIDEGKILDIVGFNLHTDERTFLETYENVTAFYDSDVSQTWELDYDKPDYKE